MENNSDKVIIERMYGNITSQDSQDEVVLIGEYLFENSNYVQNIKLVLNPQEGIPISINVPYNGYDMQLFIGDFNNDKKSEIMVRGSFGGSGGFEIAVIYKYENNELVEIFSQESFNKNNNCSANFQDNYKVNVKCGKRKYSIDLSNRPKDYLDLIYNPDGTLKSDITVYIDSPYAFYPVKQVYSPYYNLLIQQRIVGIANVDTLGVIETLATLLDDIYDVEYKGLLLVPSPI